MRLDHVSYATSPGEFVDTVQRFGSSLGAPLLDGGRHPRFGTRNFVLPLNSRTYVEVVTTLDHPATDASPFGRAVKARADQGGGWLGWVIAVDDIAGVEARLGRESVEGHRVRPDGFDLRWRQLGVNGLLADAQLPFFVQWTSDPAEHPSAQARAQLSIAAIEMVGDPTVVSDWIGQDAGQPLEGVDVTWVTDDSGEREAGIASVTFATAQGAVLID